MRISLLTTIAAAALMAGAGLATAQTNMPSNTKTSSAVIRAPVKCASGPDQR